MQLNNTPRRHTFILALDNISDSNLAIQLINEEMLGGRVPINMSQIGQAIYGSSKGTIYKAIIDLFPDGHEEVIYPENWSENT